MTDIVEPAPTEERSQTRTLIRHDDFDADDDDDVVTVDKDRRHERRRGIERSKDRLEPDEASSESTAPPSRATTDPASTIRDSGYSDANYGSRNFTPGDNIGGNPATAFSTLEYDLHRQSRGMYQWDWFGLLRNVLMTTFNAKVAQKWSLLGYLKILLLWLLF